MGRRRGGVQLRPARPESVCEACGSEIWWAWGIHGKVWTPLTPQRLPMSSGDGTYEVWRDMHGGLLTRYRAPGMPADQVDAWRGQHHNVRCGARWLVEVVQGLASETEAAIPVIGETALLELARVLQVRQEDISREIRRRAAAADEE